jgi:hypothetical protein
MLRPCPQDISTIREPFRPVFVDPLLPVLEAKVAQIQSLGARCKQGKIYVRPDEMNSEHSGKIGRVTSNDARSISPLIGEYAGSDRARARFLTY